MISLANPALIEYYRKTSYTLYIMPEFKGTTRGKILYCRLPPILKFSGILPLSGLSGLLILLFLHIHSLNLVTDTAESFSYVFYLFYYPVWGVLLFREYHQKKDLSHAVVEIDQEPLKPWRKARIMFIFPGLYHVEKAEIRLFCYSQPLVGELVHLKGYHHESNELFIDPKIKDLYNSEASKYREVVDRILITQAADISSQSDNTLTFDKIIEIPRDAAQSQEQRLCRIYWRIRVVLQGISQKGKNQVKMRRNNLSLVYPVRVDSFRDVTWE